MFRNSIGLLFVALIFFLNCSKVIVIRDSDGEYLGDAGVLYERKVFDGKRVEEPSVRCHKHPLFRQPCHVGRGACVAMGTYVCKTDSQDVPLCDAKKGHPAEEICNNNIDDDCDGLVDDTPCVEKTFLAYSPVGKSTYFTSVMHFRGYIYAAGFFSSMSLNGQKVPSQGGVDIFLLKMSPDGTIIWVRSYGGKFEDKPAQLIALKDGYVLVGQFEKEIVFHSTTKLTSWSRDVFVAKFSSKDEFMWAKAADVESDAKALGGCVDEQNIYITGAYKEKLPLGNNDPNEKNAFLVSFAVSDGTLKWSKIQTGTNALGVGVLSGPKTGSIYWFQIALEAGDLQSVNKKVDARELIVANLDSDGTVRWTQKLAEDYIHTNPRWHMNEDETFTLADIIKPPVTFHNQTFKGNAHYIVLARWEQKGRLLWSKLYGSAVLNYTFDCASSSFLGEISMVAEHLGVYKADSYSVKTDTNSSFLMKVDLSGRVSSLQSLGSTKKNLSTFLESVVLQTKEHTFVLGTFLGPVQSLGRKYGASDQWSLFLYKEKR
mgnify:CR=1 FL=1|jgi:hypothetical protein|tara:strand:+ start:639 stop:2267 length:1629 start_codon:yes stop_codon:yes gene_type:complete